MQRRAVGELPPVHTRGNGTDDVLAAFEDGQDRIHPLATRAVRQGGIELSHVAWHEQHAIGVKSQELLRALSCADSHGFTAREASCVLADLPIGETLDPHQAEVVTVKYVAQSFDAHCSCAPLDYTIRRHDLISRCQIDVCRCPPGTQSSVRKNP